MSDLRPIEAEEGLKNVVEKFKMKKDFLIEVKKNNQNKNKNVTKNREIHHKFIKTTQDKGYVPLPILLKIRKGILYIPSTYTISEGLSLAMREILPLAGDEGDFHLERAVL
jgi:hypothetical protein